MLRGLFVLLAALWVGDRAENEEEEGHEGHDGHEGDDDQDPSKHGELAHA